VRAVPKEDPRPAPKDDPKPDPKADPREKPKADPKEKPRADPPAVARKNPRVPDAASQERVRRLVQEKYKDEYAKKKPADILETAELLVAKAIDAEGDPVLQFVLFCEARDQALRAGNLNRAMQIIDDIGKHFECDVLRLKIAFLENVIRRTTDPVAARAFFQACLVLMVAPLDQDDYADVQLLLRIAGEAAGKTRDSSPTVIKLLTAELKKMAEEYVAARWAAPALKTRPDDPKANYAWGRYLAVIKGHWEKGLPLLAKGSNAEVKKLAIKELDAPVKADEQLALGRGWEEASKKEQGSARKRVLLHANFWYTKALAGLDGSNKQQLQAHVKDIENILNTDEEALRVQMANSFTALASEIQRQQALMQMAELQQLIATRIQAYIQAQLELQQRQAAAAAALQAQRQAQYQAHMAQGQQLLQKKQFAAAAGEFRAALQIVPGDAAAQAGLQQAQRGR
jgi:hypothetical protein